MGDVKRILNWAQAASLRQRGKWNTGPDAPHVGWQVGKKTSKKVGHILLDDVPAGRPKKKDSNCSL